MPAAERKEKGHPVSEMPFLHQNSLAKTANHETKGKVMPMARRRVVPFDWLVSIARKTVMWRLLLLPCTGLLMSRTPRTRPAVGSFQTLNQRCGDPKPSA